MEIMITLYQFPAAYGLSSMSPFCTKVEVYFKLADIDYQLEYALVPFAPKRKLPYIDDDGIIVADSSDIISHCRSNYGDSLDDGLSKSDHAIGHALQRTLEEHFYWSLVYSRWIDPAGWAVYRKQVWKLLPFGLRWPLLLLSRRRMKTYLHGQGLGRHKAADIYDRGVADIDSIANFLGDRHFLFGDRPCSYDAVLYAFMRHVSLFPVESPLTRSLYSHEKLLAYTVRMKDCVGI